MSKGSTRPRRRARAAALARAGHRCQQLLDDGDRCGAPAVAALAVRSPAEGGDLGDADNLAAACAPCARRAYSAAAQLENARRRQQAAPPAPVTAASSPAAIRAAVLRHAGHRCQQLLDDGRRCPSTATAVVRRPDQLDAHAGTADDPLRTRHALCNEHARQSYATTARRGAALRGWSPPTPVDQLTGAAARIAADLDRIGAPRHLATDPAARLLRAAGLSAGGSTPRQVAVTWRQAQLPPPLPRHHADALLDAATRTAHATEQLLRAARAGDAVDAAQLVRAAADQLATATALAVHVLDDPPTTAHDRSTTP